MSATELFSATLQVGLCRLVFRIAIWVGQCSKAVFCSSSKTFSFSPKFEDICDLVAANATQNFVFFFKNHCDI